ncbi:hypothetical protein ACNKHW_06055 [Shigella flexneri]
MPPNWKIRCRTGRRHRFSNPPYGERLESEPALIALHSVFGRVVKTRSGLASHYSAHHRSFSAACNCVRTNGLRRKTARWTVCRKTISCEDTTGNSAGIGISLTVCARTEKKLAKWAKQEGVECYRLYDADLPEYNVAVDRYADCGGAGIRTAENG